MTGEAIVAVFPTRVFLSKALEHVMALEEFDVRHAIIIARTRDGEIVVLDDDIGPGEAVIAGAALGALMMGLGVAQLGALTLPGIGPLLALGAALLAGGVVGALVSRIAAGLIVLDFRNLQVKTLAAELRPGHPALVLEMGEGADMLPRLREELTPYQAEVVEYLQDARYAVARLDEQNPPHRP